MLPNDPSATGSAPPEPSRSAACDILVIGGGPAGSTAAIALAQKGYRVVVLEKSRHPRFHIGESLLPANLPLLERLGVAEKVRSIGMPKWGAEFISGSDGRHQEYQFADAWNKSLPMSYQVRRSEFDEILIRRAAAVGAEVVEGCRVRNVDFGADSVRIHAVYEDGSSGYWDAAQVIDASGRETVLGNRLGSKRRIEEHNSSAMYAHFIGVPRPAGRGAGNICVYWFEHGWLWFIPLADGTTSVGAVVWPYYMKSRAVPLRDFFLSAIALCPPLAERLRAAELSSEVEATGNYAYACERSYGDKYLLVGDAFTFIDPVFSSGVMLAMNSAMAAAETIDSCRRNPARSKTALRRFDRIMRHGPREFSWFIYRMTNPTMRELFLAPRNVLRMQEALLSMLAGDLFGRTPIWRSLRAFKILYFVISLVNFGRTLRAVRSRAAHIRAVEPEPMTGG